MLNKITKWIFYIFSFLLPLAFLPESSFVYYFDKKIFLAIFVFLLFGSWMLKSFSSGSLKYPAGRTAKAVLALSVAFFASSAFSGIFNSSFFGSTAQSVPFFNFGLCFLIFFLSAAILENEKEVFKSLKFFTAGCSVLALSFLILGFFAMAGQKVLNFGAGDLSQVLSLVFGAGLAALIAVLSLSKEKIFNSEIKYGKALNIGVPFLEGALLISAISFIDFRLTWFLVILTLIIIFCRLLAVPSSKVARTAVLGAFILSLFLFFFGSPFKAQFNYPSLPGKDLSLSIAQNTLMESPKNFFFGSGLATFSNQFALHNNGALNQTVFSGVLFEQAAFGVLTLLVETGILGLIILFILIGAFFWQGFKLIASRNEEDDAVLVSFAVAYYFILIFFFFWMNFGLLALFFWALGMFAAAERQKEIIFADKPELKKTGAAIIALAGLTISIFAVYVSVQQYSAAITAQKSSQAYGRGETEQAFAQANKAISFWQQDDYYILLSSLYLRQADNFLKSKSEASEALSENDQISLQKIADQAVAAAGHACMLNPKKTVNWHNLGLVYGNLVFINENAAQSGLDAYNKAEELYPQNLGVFLGRAFIYEATGDAQKAMEEYQKYSSMIPFESEEAQAAREKIEQLKQSAESFENSAATDSSQIEKPDSISLPGSEQEKTE